MTRGRNIPVDPNDKRTHPQETNPLKPKPRRDPMDYSAPEWEKYLMKLDRKAMQAQRRARIKARANDPTAKLPPICGAVLEKPIKAGSDQDRLTPNEIRLYGLEETYLSTCTRYAGAGTDHEGAGYCRDCERVVKRKLETSDRSMTKRKRNNAMTASQLRKFHGQVMRNRDILGMPIDIGPHEAILEEVHRTAGIVAWLEDLIRDLDRKNLEENPDASELIVLQQFTKLGIAPSAVWSIYESERKHLVEASRAAIACGVAERRVRLAEEQGRLMVMVLQAFIYDPELGLTPAQIQKAPAIMRKHLMALPRDENPEAYVDRLATAPTRQQLMQPVIPTTSSVSEPEAPQPPDDGLS